jgi:serine/threonine protein kinase
MLTESLLQAVRRPSSPKTPSSAPSKTQTRLLSKTLTRLLSFRQDRFSERKHRLSSASATTTDSPEHSAGESDYELETSSVETITLPSKPHSNSEATSATPNIVAEEMQASIPQAVDEIQVACARYDAEGLPRRNAFVGARLSIVEARRNPFCKCLMLVDDAGKHSTVPLCGAKAHFLSAISTHCDDVQPSFSSNSVGIRPAGSVITWIVASRSAGEKRRFLDRLCEAGCIMDDLVEHFALLHQPSALASNLRYGRLTSARATTNSNVVVKVASNEEKTKQLINEVQFLLHLHHDGIVGAHGLYAARSGGDLSLGMLLDFKEAGDLESWIPTDGFPEWMVCRLSAQICDAMLYLHDSLVVHRDMKPSNVLCEVAHDGSVKLVIADFGVAAYAMDKKTITKRAGTAGFVAPEVLEKGWEMVVSKATVHNITKIDVYSIGMLIYTIAFGSNPFIDESDTSSDAILRRNASGSISLADMYGRSDELKSLLTRLLAKNPRKRFLISDAIAHPWFSDRGGSYSDGNLKSAKVSWSDFEEADKFLRTGFRVERACENLRK